MRLRVEDLALERGGRLVLAKLRFQLGEGEVLVVTGPNGAGKTTLLRALAGLLPLAAGRIVVEGGDPELSQAEQLHFVGHRDGVKEALTATENLVAWRGLLGGEGSDPAAALNAVALDHAADLPAGTLSAGQRRRLGLARLLVAPRPLWLLDEPATALDVAAQARLAKLVATHRAGGGLVVAATHAALAWPECRTLTLTPGGAG
ncbi:MAG TPA: heme ABC exporter ATP-binding protein CcmA [Hyphomicrobiales bacterium]|nr:heme ABC exporter ATP-binding protein CcmA [Hyphomicrobiales bacterium]